MISVSTTTDLIRRYFDLLARFSTDRGAFEEILHPDVRQREFPNLLNRHGQESDLADLLRRAALGKTILAKQSYDITNVVEGTGQAVVEAVWRGELAADVGTLKVGQKLMAYFCVLLELKDGKIYRQRNYDCFESF